MSNPVKNAKRQPALVVFLYICFFLSGAAGLIYEVVWARQLSLFLGITGFAHTAVITAYMAGLAGGSWYFGRRSDQLRYPLRTYAWLEIGVGCYAALTPWMFNALQIFYAEVAGAAGVEGAIGHLVRFSIALLALLIPTFLMGGTLPLLVRGVVTQLPDVGRITSRLYGVNTLGAMSGTLLAGYVLLEQIGIRATIFVGVTINLGIAVAVLRVPGLGTMGESRKDENVTAVESDFEDRIERSQYSAGLRFALLVGFGAAGFAALLTQLAWIRTMILLVGGSVYAFTIALASFLAGIGLGSLAYTRVFSKPATVSALQHLPYAGIVAWLVGLTIIGGIPLLAQLPLWFLAGLGAGLMDHFSLFQLYIFCLAFALMLLPTLFMGLLFPLVTTIWTRQITSAGQSVGTAYAVNTAGTILGSLVGGLVLLPWLGIQNSLILAGAIYACVALLFWAASSQRFALPIRLGVPMSGITVLLLIALLIPRWDSIVWGRGVYYAPTYTLEQLSTLSLHDIMAESRMLYYNEGLDGTVVVTDNGDQRYLIINGKTEASSKGDLQTQLLLGVIPALLHPDPRNALVIGLGSGITAGAVAAYDSLEEITVLEMLPEVVEASEFFVEENRHVLDDPRVHLVSADARNYVLSTQRKWDLIVSEPSNPWVSGVSNLFTLDFFELIEARLTEGGIMAQWFHVYDMSLEDMKTVFRTYNQAFHYVTIWNIQIGDLVLIGSNKPYAIDLERFEKIQANEKTAFDLQRAEINDAREFLRHYLFSGEQFNSFIEGSELNTDNNPVIEFNAPKYMYADTSMENMIEIAKHIDGRPSVAPVSNFYQRTARGLDVLAMNITIDFPNPARVTELEAYWLVWREPLPANSSNYDNYGTGSFRQLHWQDGQASRRVQASWLEYPLDQATAEAFLEQMLTLPSVHGGKLSLGEGVSGRWLIAVQQQQMEIGLIWACRQNVGAYTRYAVYSQLPNPGEPQWTNQLSLLASQFKCQ